MRPLHIIICSILAQFAIFSTPLHAGNEDSYVLRPNDVIRLAVYEEPDLSVQLKILKTGQASFPLIGSVDVGGLTVSVAAEKIRELYAKDYLVDPKLTLSVDDYATDFVSVIGAVNHSGQIPIPPTGTLDIAAALATAGGLAANADMNNITLVRANGATSSYSFASIQGSSGRVRLASGDRIIVNQSAYVGKTLTILGKVAKPGPISFPIDGRLDLVTAISLAGGITELGNPKKVSINRRGNVTVVNFRELSQNGNVPYYLQPDDVITVAERLF